jgi:hypothetical protein
MMVENGTLLLARPHQLKLAGMPLHDNNWHFHLVATDNRTLDLREPKPFIEPDGVER